MWQGIGALPFPSGLGLRHSPDARRGALAEIGRVLRTLFVPSRRLKASFQRRSRTKKPDDLHHPAYFCGERGIRTPGTVTRTSV